MATLYISETVGVQVDDYKRRNDTKFLFLRGLINCFRRIDNDKIVRISSLGCFITFARFSNIPFVPISTKNSVANEKKSKIPNVVALLP